MLVFTLIKVNESSALTKRRAGLPRLERRGSMRRKFRTLATENDPLVTPQAGRWLRPCHDQMLIVRRRQARQRRYVPTAPEELAVGSEHLDLVALVIQPIAPTVVARFSAADGGKPCDVRHRRTLWTRWQISRRGWSRWQR